MKICFMGTPDIAVPTLQVLLDHHEVVCVVTQPDRPKGRGNKLSAPPVKELAIRHHIPVLQPERARDPAFFAALKNHHFDVIVVIAYGQLLPETILTMCRHGALNIHGSLLPKYRGASPIQSAIIQGEAITGVTIMQMNVGMDTGDILLQKKIPIENHTSGDLFTLMGQVGAETLLEALAQIENGSLTRTPQDETQATHAPMLTKEMGLIDWTKTSQEIVCLVNGLNPWPVAYTLLGEMPLKIYKASPRESFAVSGGSKEKPTAKKPTPGTVLAADTKNGIVVQTGDGALALAEVQAKGGKRMPSEEYVKGNPIEVDLIFLWKKI